MLTAEVVRQQPSNFGPPIGPPFGLKPAMSALKARAAAPFAWVAYGFP